jgi:hypothetical protein
MTNPHKKAEQWFLPLLIAGLVAFINLKFAYSYQFFVGDDWDWLYTAQFSSIGQIFTFLPGSVYNDRPVGALVIKLMYQLFGLNSDAFYLAQLVLHIINCWLLFAITKKYLGVGGAALAAVLAGTWVVANDAVFWTAAIFDLVGATACLLSIFLWQLGVRQNHLVWIVLGALVYFLSIRTKEFAISLPIVILAISWLLEKQSLRASITRLWPYWIVMGVMGAWYGLLMQKSAIVGNSDAYGLHFSGILENLNYYLGTMFYENLWDPQRRVWNAFHGFMILVAAILWVLAVVRSTDYRKVFIVCAIGFLGLLGPTLLLKNHLGQLYLYAPHFFLAMAIGALYPLGLIYRIVIPALCIALIVFPLSSQWFYDKRDYYVSHTLQTREQFELFQKHLPQIAPGSQVFIANLAQWNSFDYQGGKPLKVMKQDDTLQLQADPSVTELVLRFCKTSAPRIFIRMQGNQSFDETAIIKAQCS